MTAQAAQGQPLLAVRDISVVFGGIVALNSVSFDMREGNILGLIGPNGAGKTTLFNCLSRLYQPSKGDILVQGETILNRPAHKICDVGIGRTFQNVALFPNMSVNDNIRVGAHWHTQGNLIGDALLFPSARRRERELNERVAGIVDYLELGAVQEQLVSGLPFGGVGESGYGSYHGRWGFETFSHRKAVLRRPGWVADPPLLNPPYGRWKQRLARRVF